MLPLLATELTFRFCCCLLQVEKAGDVIAFYNQVFVPEVKPSLMRLHQARATLPRPPTLSTTNPFTSPVRVQSRLEFPANGFSTPPPANRWAVPCHVQATHLQRTLYMSQVYNKCACHCQASHRHSAGHVAAKTCLSVMMTLLLAIRSIPPAVGMRAALSVPCSAGSWDWEAAPRRCLCRLCASLPSRWALHLHRSMLQQEMHLHTETLCFSTLQLFPHHGD